MSAVIDQIPGLFDFLKRRLRLPDATTAVPADALPPPALSNPGFTRPRVALPENAESFKVRDTAAQTPSLVAPIEPPMMRPRVALPNNSLRLGDPASVGADWTLPAGDVPMRPTSPSIDYEPIRIDETTGRAINNVTRPRIADPTAYSFDRLKQMEVEGQPEDRNGKLKSILIGMGRGFQRGGLGGLVSGGIYGGVKSNWDEREGQAEDLEHERGRVGRLVGLDKEQAALEQQQALTDYTKLRPAIEATKIADLRDYREGSLDLKRQAGESLEDFRNRSLGLKQDISETEQEFKERVQKWNEQKFERTAGQRDRALGQGDRRIGISEKQGNERLAQGRERIGIARAGLRLRERLGEGGLDARWAGIAQGYDRLDASRQKQVDALATKAAAAEAQAAYFDTQKDEKGNSQAAAAQLKRTEAEQLRKQAASITARPAPRTLRPPRTATPPTSSVSEDAIRAAAAARGLNPDTAVQRARQRGLLQ